jgi:hypothetical protein
MYTTVHNEHRKNLDICKKKSFFEALLSMIYVTDLLLNNWFDIPYQRMNHDITEISLKMELISITVTIKTFS